MQYRGGWVAALVVTAACANGSDPVVDPQLTHAGPIDVTLAAGRDTAVAGVRIHFVAVAGDSRCPSDVVCVWAGDAEIQAGVGPLTGSGPIHEVRLHSLLEPRSTDRGVGGEPLGVRLTLLEVTPVPLSTAPTPPAAYQVRLRVEPVATP